MIHYLNLSKLWILLKELLPIGSKTASLGLNEEELLLLCQLEENEEQLFRSLNDEVCILSYLKNPLSLINALPFSVKQDGIFLQNKYPLVIRVINNDQNETVFINVGNVLSLINMTGIIIVTNTTPAYATYSQIENAPVFSNTKVLFSIFNTLFLNPKPSLVIGAKNNRYKEKNSKQSLISFLHVIKAKIKAIAQATPKANKIFFWVKFNCFIFTALLKFKTYQCHITSLINLSLKLNIGQFIFRRVLYV